MSFFLRIYRILLLAAWFLITGTIGLFVCFGGVSAVKRVSRITSLWARGIAKIINMRIKVYGNSEEIKGSLIVSNHLGYLDIIAHAATFSIRFAPKSDIAGWPFLGWFIAISRPIWVDRRSRQSSQKTLDAFGETLAGGVNLIVYPEGTSSDGKDGILPFKSTPFEAAVLENCPIYPSLIVYREKEGNPALCWYGGMTLLPHVWRVLGIRFIDVEIQILPPLRPEGRNRKELAVHVHDLMREQWRRQNPGVGGPDISRSQCAIDAKPEKTPAS